MCYNNSVEPVYEDSNLTFYVRRMCKEDVPQVKEIDREAFPTQWPPPNFQHELRNRLSCYIVACNDERTVAQSDGNSTKNLLASLRWLFARSSDHGRPQNNHGIIGYVGLWVLADEAHITSIAVRDSYRGQGLGELLLIAAIDEAARLKAQVVTLEVRISNTVAQNLYKKYGFTEVGIRQGYYIDNREDARLMSTRDINSAEFRQQFGGLKQSHAIKEESPSKAIS
jgi:ribosomal-protein-alanine N-acetyltransferase